MTIAATLQPWLSGCTFWVKPRSPSAPGAYEAGEVTKLPPLANIKAPQTPLPGSSPKTPEQKQQLAELLAAAARAYNVGNYPEAEQRWRKACEVDEASSEAWLGLAHIWLLRHVIDEDDNFALRARDALNFVSQHGAQAAQQQAQRLLQLLEASRASRRR